MNGDGKLDILYTNGDILDEPYLLKPYHGIQWLENRGDLKFEHHRIADMYGVHHAVAANITGNKLPDILAVSFLPADKFSDRGKRKADAVVLFEQVCARAIRAPHAGFGVLRRGGLRCRRSLRDWADRSRRRQLQFTDQQ